MFGFFMVDAGFFRNICFCFDLVAGFVNRTKVTLTIFPTVNQRNSVVTHPSFGDNLDGANATDAAMVSKNPNANARRNGRVIILSNPFLIQTSAHRTPCLIARVIRKQPSKRCR
jgi:hypothetical protein